MVAIAFITYQRRRQPFGSDDLVKWLGVPGLLVWGFVALALVAKALVLPFTAAVHLWGWLTDLIGAASVAILLVSIAAIAAVYVVDQRRRDSRRRPAACLKPLTSRETRRRKTLQHTYLANDNSRPTLAAGVVCEGPRIYSNSGGLLRMLRGFACPASGAEARSGRLPPRSRAANSLCGTLTPQSATRVVPHRLSPRLYWSQRASGSSRCTIVGDGKTL